MPKTRTRNEVDEHVGERVRSRRKALGMNQTALAQKLGVTFQMVQRYEYGLCRISASTLFAIAHALEAPISYFFEGLPVPSGKRLQPSAGQMSTREMAKTRNGREMASLFPRIAHRGSQRAIVELVRAMVGDDIKAA
ncbi:MAG: helix-turn-helix transcriptional regulator [Alphaproteobacteria bacterium]|nr:helix-turn-helix transcriptional regulator [Alphaproteobacteria bacterium]